MRQLMETDMVDSSNNTFSDMTWEEIDRFAWDALRNWPQAAGFDPIHERLDFSELTRWYLWDKVGRAVRAAVAPDDFPFEAREMAWSWPISEGSYWGRDAWSARWRNLKERLRRFQPTQNAEPISPSPTPSTDDFTLADIAGVCVLVPVPSERLANAVRTIVESDAATVITPEVKYVIPGAVRVPIPDNLPPPDLAFGVRLHDAIRHGLKHQGIALLPGDINHLKKQIFTQLAQLRSAEALIAEVRPRIMLLHADNHPTHQHYVLLGRREGIPSVMLQHGLDCERFYLDEAYADAIAVWGMTRKSRYLHDSTWQPSALEITGNPQYDSLRLPESLDLSGNYWLWVTRPHSPVKCYSPSRSPQEGLDICRALLDTLRASPNTRLLVKPHPMDGIPVLRECLEKSGLGRRAMLTDKPPLELIPHASVVISEDSTAGMEAMFHGKTLVHAHFAPTPPTMPFVDYRAALPGFDPAQLRASLLRCAYLEAADQAVMLAGQRAFLVDFAGLCDGHAGERVRDFLFRQLGKD